MAERAAALGLLQEGQGHFTDGHHDEAIDCFRRGLRTAQAFGLPGRAQPGMDPRPDLYNALGVALRTKDRTAEARTAFEDALRLAPQHAMAHANLGVLEHLAGNYAAAEPAIRRALQIQPDLVLARTAWQVNLVKQYRLEEVIAYCREVLRAQPENLDAQLNLGLALLDGGHAAEGQTCFRTILSQDPDSPTAASNLLFSLLYDPQPNVEAVAEEHRLWGERCAALVPAQTRWDNVPDPERPLRIGYVSADLCAHPVGIFIRPILQGHDRRQVYAVCYADVERSDYFTEELRKVADSWHDVRQLDDSALAARITADRIDILVDLSGHTAKNRLRVFARKPAPLQVTYLGYPFTTGLPAIDYLLADAVVCPRDDEHLYVEKVVRLPGCFLSLRPHPEAPLVARRPGDGPITFGCFNHVRKLSAAIIAAWSAILRALPDARLVLKARPFVDATTRQCFAGRFEAHGIAPERIEMRGYSPLAAMLAEYGDLDLALDPFPFNGGTTTCDALWMGAPVLTLAGRGMAARMGASLLQTAGLPQLVTTTPEEYVARAVELANDRKGLAELRAGLRTRLGALTATAEHARRLEHAYREMWRRWCAVS